MTIRVRMGVLRSQNRADSATSHHFPTHCVACCGQCAKVTVEVPLADPQPLCQSSKVKLTWERERTREGYTGTPANARPHQQSTRTGIGYLLLRSGLTCPKILDTRSNQEKFRIGLLRDLRPQSCSESARLTENHGRPTPPKIRDLERCLPRLGMRP